MGVRQWNVTTATGEMSVHGNLVFTPMGTAPVWCDCHQPHLVLGFARGRWSTIDAAMELARAN
jgi:hypothetical protein